MPKMNLFPGKFAHQHMLWVVYMPPPGSVNVDSEGSEKDWSVTTSTSSPQFFCPVNWPLKQRYHLGNKKMIDKNGNNIKCVTMHWDCLLQRTGWILSIVAKIQFKGSCCSALEGPRSAKRVQVHLPLYLGNRFQRAYLEFPSNCYWTTEGGKWICYCVTVFFFFMRLYNNTWSLPRWMCPNV